MEENKINIFNSYIKSIFDFNSYNFFYKRSLGKAFLYLLILTIVLGGISIIRPLYNINTAFNTLLTNYPNSVPEFNFKNGILDVQSDTPIIYNYPGTELIIDTSGQTTSSVIKQSASQILITKDHIYQKDNFGNVTDTPLNAFKELDFDKNSIEKLLPTLQIIITIIVIIFCIVKFFIGYLLNALILSLIALLINNLIINSKTTFKDFYKLSIYALTLSTTFNLIITSMDKSIPSITTYLTLIFYAVGLIYIIKALHVIKLNEN